MSITNYSDLPQNIQEQLKKAQINAPCEAYSHALYDAAQFCIEAGRDALAREFIEKAIKNQGEYKNTYSSEDIVLHITLSQIDQRLGNNRLVKQSLIRAAEVAAVVDGAQSVSYAQCKFKLGDFLMQRVRYSEALVHLQEAYDIVVAHKGENDPSVRSIKEMMRTAQARLEQHPKHFKASH